MVGSEEPNDQSLCLSQSTVFTRISHAHKTNTHIYAMESFATPYPVIFHDGDREHDKGHIGVHSVLTFKRFQALLSQKVGLPAGQVTAVFVCRRTARETDNRRQKLPINENTNFNIILNQHNPKSEKDCHFLVSMKKSKKERKGGRRRSAEAENGEDGSISPRGDVSPRSEEACKEGECINDGESTETGLLQEGSLPSGNEMQLSRESNSNWEAEDSGIQNGASHLEEVSEQVSSPAVPIQRSPRGSPQPLSSNPVSPTSPSPPVSDTSARPVIMKSQESSPLSPHQWFGNGAASEVRPTSDKILLRRDPSNPVSSIRGWQNMDTRPVGSVSSVPVESIVTHSSNRHATDTRTGDKAWLKSELLDGRPILPRNDRSWVAGPPFQQQALVSRNAEALQERFNDPVLGRSPVLLQRNGILNLSGTSTPPVLLPATRPLVFSPMDNMLLPRVSSGISGLASGSNAAINLQQAQAHYLNLQAQQSEQMYLNLQALSKMRGVVRGLAAYDNGNHKPSGVCQHCYRFQERKINPTPFHLCVHDRITNGFRGPSPAGPIERPVKRVEAAA